MYAMERKTGNTKTSWRSVKSRAKYAMPERAMNPRANAMLWRMTAYARKLGPINSITVHERTSLTAVATLNNSQKMKSLERRVIMCSYAPMTWDTTMVIVLQTDRQKRQAAKTTKLGAKAEANEHSRCPPLPIKMTRFRPNLEMFYV